MSVPPRKNYPQVHTTIPQMQSTYAVSNPPKANFLSGNTNSYLMANSTMSSTNSNPVTSFGTMPVIYLTPSPNVAYYMPSCNTIHSMAPMNLPLPFKNMQYQQVHLLPESYIIQTIPTTFPNHSAIPATTSTTPVPAASPVSHLFPANSSIASNTQINPINQITGSLSKLNLVPIPNSVKTPLASGEEIKPVKTIVPVNSRISLMHVRPRRKRNPPPPMLYANKSASGTSPVAIDNKIEQAMDLVKSHLMYAVREEVEVLKEKIAELMDRIGQLEAENSLLKAHASQETLAQLGGAKAAQLTPQQQQPPPQQQQQQQQQQQTAPAQTAAPAPTATAAPAQALQPQPTQTAVTAAAVPASVPSAGTTS